MKRCMSLIFLILCTKGISQEIEFTKKLPFPDNPVSSELSLSYMSDAPNQLRAAVLAVKPVADKPDYYTIVMTSEDGGLNWKLKEEPLTNEAADPWILGMNQNQFVLSDISEGSKFHLKTFLNNGKEWAAPVSHGLGHDHATILKDSDNYYLFSTQKTSDNMLLYFYRGGKGIPVIQAYELFNGADFSVKKPVILESQIAIPVVLRGDWNGESSNRLEQMTSWLVFLDKSSLKLTTPQLMTMRSGAKHHVLVKGNEGTLFYFYTDVERKRLEVIKSNGSDQGWSELTLIAESENLINLDAASWHKDQAVIVFTKEEEKGIFQKYLCNVSAGLSISNTLKLGQQSKPDQRNGWAGRAWPQGGDYCGLISLNEDILYVMWSSAPDGIFKPYFSKINTK
ncbi:hypothetical protein AAOE16_14935 [Ekhidna sp. MALMAid0563]|uniref:hypothetical protein n=1 Tax=Ekhidna sp. MALMAid0563 TaxID=3143937 RepID=UPI0032DE8891